VMVAVSVAVGEGVTVGGSGVWVAVGGVAGSATAVGGAHALSSRMNARITTLNCL